MYKILNFTYFDEEKVNLTVPAVEFNDYMEYFKANKPYTDTVSGRTIWIPYEKVRYLVADDSEFLPNEAPKVEATCPGVECSGKDD